MRREGCGGNDLGGWIGVEWRYFFGNEGGRERLLFGQELESFCGRWTIS